MFRSEFPIHLSTRLPEFYRFFLHTALQRPGFRNADLRGVVAHILRDLHGAEMRTALYEVSNNFRLRPDWRMMD